MSQKHDVMLDLDINSFGTDQTPTPTKLYNCEEYGIFEDLKLVNPFDEIFRHAVEEKNGKVNNSEPKTTQPAMHDEESLHTPQVYPQIEATNTIAPIAIRQHSTPLITDLVMPDVAEVATKKYRAIAEKPILQAQMVPVNLSENIGSNVSNKVVTTGTAIPIQTVKPLILPKVETKLKPNIHTANGTGLCTVTSPSSASLTPTSQLPIKERLKVILNSNSKTQRALVPTEVMSKCNKSIERRKSTSTSGKYDERCMERRRAAATRYRNKMRNEHKELRKRTSELQAENDKLRLRVAELEQQLMQRTALKSQQSLANNTNITNTTMPIQVPPSSIHLIMNIPKLIVPANGPPLMHNPITYSVEKK